jgi:hypothetical protein
MTPQQQYNQLLKRWNNAEIYFAKQDIKLEEKLKYVPQCQQLTNDMSKIIDALNLTDEQILNGFAEE